MKWNPQTHPYRLRTIRANGGYGMYGWSDSVETFESLDEAVDKMNAKMTGRVVEFQVDVARLSDGKHVGWTSLASRKRGKEAKYTKAFKSESNR